MGNCKFCRHKNFVVIIKDGDTTDKEHCSEFDMVLNSYIDNCKKFKKIEGENDE